MNQSTQFIITGEDQKTLFAGSAKEVINILNNPSELGYPVGKQVANNMDTLQVTDVTNNGEPMDISGFLSEVQLANMADDIDSIRNELKN